MTRISKRASVHPSTVTAVSKGEVGEKRAGRSRKAPRSLAFPVEKGRVHPAYVMAHALGIEQERVEILADPPMWSCIIHNNGSWSSDSERSKS